VKTRNVELIVSLRLLGADDIVTIVPPFLFDIPDASVLYRA